MIFRKIVYTVLAGSHRRQGIGKIRTLESKLLSREARFAVPFVYRGSGLFKKIEPRQNPFEIEKLYQKICSLSPQKVLEIGTARGGTLYLWTQAATDDAVIVSVDLPGGDFGGAYPESRIPFYESFARPSQKLHLLRCDSHEPETLRSVQAIFGKEPLDFAFIDGDHTYEGVKADFSLYGPLVRPGGLICFHDILRRDDQPDIRVYRFWQEIRGSFDTEEIIGPDGSGKKIGIGLLRVGPSGVRPKT